MTLCVWQVTVSPIIVLVDADTTSARQWRDQIETPKDHFERSFGLVARGRYWKVLEDLFVELGYRDYMRDLQRNRAEHPRHAELLSISSFLWITPSPTAVSSGPRCADAAA